MAEKSNSTLKDIISKNELISSGTPAVCQLKSKKEKTKNLTRVTVGEKNTNRSNKTILLVGETGAGKSTMINALLNYIMGMKWEDGVWFQIVEEKATKQTESQTSDVIVYEIFGFEGKTLPYSLTIIDTLGFGDTRGIKRDDIVSEKLLNLFRSNDGVHEVHAVGLVMKASDNRLTDRLRYVFDAMMSLFGKDLEKNIVALITHSDGNKPRNPLNAIKEAGIKCAKNEENEPVYFLFNNRDPEDKTDKEEMTGMREFTAFLDKSEPRGLVMTVDVLDDRIRLTACIQNLQEKIKMIDLKQTEIKQIQEALKKHEEKMKKNEKFTVETDEVYKDKEPVDGGMWGLVFYQGAVCCTVCEETCHYPGCTKAWKPAHCEVIKDGRCTVCTNKCPASDHVKEKWRYVIKTRKVQKTVKEMKEKYEKNKSEHENKLSLLQNLEMEMIQLTAEKSWLLEESYLHVITLEHIALKADSASTIVHLDFLIEKMKETGDTEKVQRLKKMRSRVDEGTKKALRYKQETLEKQSKKQNSNSTSKDIIKSDLISSGPPAVYQLKTKKEKTETLTRVTVGEKNPNKINKTILLVGETGAGKSTMINALLNYSMRVKREDGVWFQIVEEKKEKKTETQTSDVIVYEIFGFEDKTLPYSLTIIDTPGFGNTGGIKCDDIIFQSLFNLFRSNDGVHEVHAVGLVMKASDNRLSDRLLYTFNTLMSLFGKDLEKNIVALITHSDGRKPKNPLQAIKEANIKSATNKENEPVYFLFNNCDIEDKTDKEEMTGMREFTAFLEKTKPQKLVMTVDVLDDRIRLTACIQNLQEKIKMIELKQTEIKQIQEALKKHEEKMKKNEKFTVETDEVYKDKEPVDGGMLGFFIQKALCCKVCEETCHYPCTMVWKPAHCEVMKNGHCTVCTNKCPASDHVKEKWRYVTKARKVQKTVKEMKEKYKNKSEHENKLSLLENPENEMNQLTAEKSQLLDESYQHVANLEQFALKADSASTIVHLDFLIEKMKETGDTEKVQKLEEMRNRVDEGTRTALRYKQETLEEQSK